MKMKIETINEVAEQRVDKMQRETEMVVDPIVHDVNLLKQKEF